MSLAERIAQTAAAVLGGLAVLLGQAEDAGRDAIRPGLQAMGRDHIDPFTPAGQAAIEARMDAARQTADARRSIAFGRFMVRWSEHQDLYGQPAWAAFPSGDDE